MGGTNVESDSWKSGSVAEARGSAPYEERILTFDYHCRRDRITVSHELRALRPCHYVTPHRASRLADFSRTISGARVSIVAHFIEARTDAHKPEAFRERFFPRAAGCALAGWKVGLGGATPCFSVPPDKFVCQHRCAARCTSIY